MRALENSSRVLLLFFFLLTFCIGEVLVARSGSPDCAKLGHRQGLQSGNGNKKHREDFTKYVNTPGQHARPD